MLNTRNKKWTAEAIYEQLRRMIMEFELYPGSRVTESELAERFRVSRTPVREALQRLSTEGHLTIRPKQGCFIRNIDIIELSHYYDVRISLEVAAIDLVAERKPRDELLKLAALWDPQTMPQGDHVTEALKDAEEDFHVQLAELSGNPVLVNYLRDVNDHIRIIRRLGWPDYKSITDTYRDHHHICQLILEGQVQEAQNVMVQHIRESQAKARTVTFAQLEQHRRKLG